MDNNNGILAKLPNLLVATYEKIWQIENSGGTSYGKLAAKSIGLSLIMNPLLAAFITAAGDMAKQEKVDMQMERLKLQVDSDILNIIALCRMAYPEKNAYEAALLAITDVSIIYGTKRIHTQHVDNGWGGDVLVSDACNKVLSQLRAHEDKYLQDKNDRTK